MALVGSFAQGESKTVPVSVFDSPSRQGDYNQLKSALPLLLNQRKWPEAKDTLNQLLEFTPWDPLLHSRLARVHTFEGDTGAALRSLNLAVESGLTDTRIIGQDPQFAALRLMPEFFKLLKRASDLEATPRPIMPGSVTPAMIKNGRVVLDADCTFYDFRSGLFHAYFAEPTEDRFTSPAKPTDPDETSLWLQSQIKAGTASGNLGDFYDNRDAGHSRFNSSNSPYLTRITYGAEAIRHNLHSGPQRHFIFNRVTIGNSSTAITDGVLWRSHPRWIYADQGLSNTLAAQYAGNQLYLYPEHLDHDPKHGDLFPANTPYLLISQGSSGSDQPFLKAFFEVLAALKPEVKAKLTRSGALMPTLQQLFRYSNRGIQSDEKYLTGEAHPTVFDSTNLDRDFLVRSANALKSDQLPPLVRLQVADEDITVSGEDHFSPRSERLFDSPQAIARVFRGMNYSRTMVVNAGASIDLNGNPLTFRWVLLRGDPDRVSITPRADGSTTELTISHHTPRPISPGNPLESNRVDIGVFAHNGTHYSAPAIVSYYFLAHEQRIYDEQNRIISVDYRQDAENPIYFDPMIDGMRTWKDEFHYATKAPHQLTGWTRTLPDGTSQQFTHHGVLIVEGDLNDGIRTVRGVRYALRHSSPEVAPSVEMELSKDTISYEEYLRRLGKVMAGQTNP